MPEASTSAERSLSGSADEALDDESCTPETALDGEAPDSGGDAPAPDELDPDDELDELELVAPAEPRVSVSANATAGMDAIAAPTPKAKASAPTRPTCVESPDVAGLISTRVAYSMGRNRTRPPVSRC